MIYNCVVVDDNVIERDLISTFIKKIPQLNIIAICENGLQAANVLTKQNVDIVFCDIDMPDLTGIELLKSLKNPPVFVFVTSFSDYAVESFNLDVIDFILKPVVFERLLKAVNKAISYLQLKNQSVEKPVFSTDTSFVEADVKDDHFFIKEAHGITRLKYIDVVYIESMGDFSKLHTTNGRTHIILSGLKNIEVQLPELIFKRVHKQYIVNLDHVSTVTPTQVHFIGKQIVRVSNMYRQLLMNAFLKKDVIKRSV